MTDSRRPDVRAELAELAATAAKFGGVGLATIAVYFVVLALLRPVIENVAVLSVAAYLISAVFNYIAQRRVTFGSRDAGTGAILRYLIMHGLCMGLNAGLLSLLVDGFGFGLFIAQVPVTGVVAATSFALSHLWVFPKRAG